MSEKLFISVHRINSDPIIAGNDIQGHIVLECSCNLKLKSLHLQIKGEESVTVPYSDFISSNIFLLLNPSIPYPSELKEGTNIVDFKALLPATLCPSSLSSTIINGRKCQIEYSIIAIAKIEEENKDNNNNEQENTQNEISNQSKIVPFDVIEQYSSKLHPISNDEIIIGRIGNKLGNAKISIEQQAFGIGDNIKINLALILTKEVPHVTISLNSIISVRNGKKIDELSQELTYQLYPINKIENTNIINGEFLLKIPTTIQASVHGTLISLQYKIGITLHIGTLLPQEISVFIPIIISHPSIIAKLSKIDDSLLLNNEFSVSSVNDIKQDIHGTRLIPKIQHKDSVFYKASQTLYCDIPKDSNFINLSLRILSSKKVTVRGRFNEIPTVFTSNIIAKELSQGKYCLTINNSNLPLKSGRWYFTITGSSFMQNSTYQMILILQSNNEDSNKDNDNEYDIVYENQQKSSLFSEYSCYKLDYPLWSDNEGNKLPCKEDISLPSNEWYWKTKWLIATPRNKCDKQGWQYATGWNATSWSSQKSPLFYVRRRIWKRQRAIKPDNYIEEDTNITDNEFNDILDEFEVIPDDKEKAIKNNEIYICPDDDSLLDDSSTIKQDNKPIFKSKSIIELDDNTDIDITYITEGGSDDEYEDDSKFYTEEEVKKLNEQIENEDNEFNKTESEFILEQERLEKERILKEEEIFNQLENDRIKRAKLLQKQREEEQKLMEESWKEKEEHVRLQIEEDKKRLQLLQESNFEELENVIISSPIRNDDNDDNEDNNEDNEEINITKEDNIDENKTNNNTNDINTSQIHITPVYESFIFSDSDDEDIFEPVID